MKKTEQLGPEVPDLKMTTTHHLKLNQPKELPSVGLTSVQFKPWKNHLINFLQQDMDNYRFLKGGDYETWKAATEVANGERIEELAATDEDLVTIAAAAEDANVKEAKKRTLKRKRNAQLSRMIQHIVTFVHYTEADDIDQSSTGLDWIFSFLQQHYNILPKGANFLKISEQTYKSSMVPQVFYKQFRADFLNNLRKKGEKVSHKGVAVLQEDEKLSPSFEDAIVLWSLEKIEPRLPAKVRKDYEHRLDGNTYLIDLQPSIFQAIPSMLADLDRDAEGSAATVPPDADLSALRSYPGRTRSTPSQGGRGGPPGRRLGQQTGYVQRECRVCKSTGKPAQVYKSHNANTCQFRRELLSSLQSILTEDTQEDDNNWSIEQEELDHQQEE